MGTISKRKNSFRVQIRHKDLDPISATFPTLEEAQAFCLHIETKYMQRIRAKKFEIALNKINTAEANL
jgi:competence transcription factor ComK